MPLRLWPSGLVAISFLLACHDPEGIAEEALALRGLGDITLSLGEGPGRYRFEAGRDGEECSGTVTVQGHDDPGTAAIELECLPPAGVWTSSLPAGSAAATVAEARRCDGGVAAACSSLGTRFLEGDGVPRDKARANLLFNQACANHDGSGCLQMAEALQGLGPDRDAEVEKLLIDACDLGSAKACGLAAQRLYNADVQSQIPTMARVARKGCDADEPQACLVLGVLLAYGLGMPMDVDLARKKLMQACGARLEAACSLVESL